MPNKKDRTLKTMEYADAPSGFVTLYNYKEPFMLFKQGYGYEGVLLMDGKTDKIQCHFCGDWFNYLPKHLLKEHNMLAHQYKTLVGLNKTTALISESARQNLIAVGLESRMKNLVKKEKGVHKVSEETKKKISAVLSKITRETQNNKGTCPEQLLDRIKLLAKQLGHVPTIREVTNVDTIKARFGSFNRALKLAGLTPRKPGENRVHRVNKNTDAENRKKVIADLRSFKDTHGRYPSMSDVRRGFLPPNTGTIFGDSFIKALIAAFPEVRDKKEFVPDRVPAPRVKRISNDVMERVLGISVKN